MNTNRYSRQILAFGLEGQKKLSGTRVAVVGVGGIGSQIAQALTYLGVTTFTLIDDDTIDDTNLNRLVGGFPSDVTEKLSKVEIAQRHILQISPSATVNPIHANLRSRQALVALTAVDVIFGCVDHDAPRQILNELAAAYEIPLVDSATEIFADTKPLQFGGRIILCRPGDFCLGCARQIDWERAKQELESGDTQEARRIHGYGLPEAGIAPSVISLNGIVANLAVTEFMVMVTGIREPARFLKYKGERGNVVFNQDPRNPDCYICGYVRGQKERANLFRYTLGDPCS